VRTRIVYPTLTMESIITISMVDTKMLRQRSRGLASRAPPRAAGCHHSSLPHCPRHFRHAVNPIPVSERHRSSDGLFSSHSSILLPVLTTVNFLSTFRPTVIRCKGENKNVVSDTNHGTPQSQSPWLTPRCVVNLQHSVGLASRTSHVHWC